jgi:hypothetical protein
MCALPPAAICRAGKCGCGKAKEESDAEGIVTIWAMRVLFGIGTLLAWLFRTLSEEIRVK